MYVMVLEDKKVGPVLIQQGHEIKTEKYNGILEGIFEFTTNLEIIT